MVAITTRSMIHPHLMFQLQFKHQLIIVNFVFSFKNYVSINNCTNLVTTPTHAHINAVFFEATYLNDFLLLLCCYLINYRYRLIHKVFIFSVIHTFVINKRMNNDTSSLSY